MGHHRISNKFIKIQVTLYFHKPAQFFGLPEFYDILYRNHIHWSSDLLKSTSYYMLVVFVVRLCWDQFVNIQLQPVSQPHSLSNLKEITSLSPQRISVLSKWKKITKLHPEVMQYVCVNFIVCDWTTILSYYRELLCSKRSWGLNFPWRDNGITRLHALVILGGRSIIPCQKVLLYRWTWQSMINFHFRFS